MEDPLAYGAQAQETEIVSFTHNGSYGKVILLRTVYNNFLHSLHVKHHYVNEEGNSISIVAEIQVAGEDELVAELQHSISNDNVGPLMCSRKVMFAKSNDAGSFGETEKLEYSSGNENHQLAEFEVSKNGFKKRLKLVDIKFEYNKQGIAGNTAGTALLLHAAGNRYTPAKSLSLEIIVRVDSTKGLAVEVKPLLYSSSFGFKRQLILRDNNYFKYYPATAPAISPPDRPGQVRRTARPTAITSRPRNSCNSGEQNFNGLVNSSGVTDGIGNNSIYINNLNFLEWRDWFRSMDDS